MSAYLGSTKVWNSSASAAEWTRPSDWLTLPTVADTENKMVGLFGVFDGGPNWCAFTVITADASSYTVDWGDGSTPDTVASNTAAQHSFNYADLGAGTLCSRGYRQSMITITVGAGKSISGISLNVRHSSASAVEYRTAWLDITISAPSATAIYPSSSSAKARPGLMEQCRILSIGTQTNFSSMFNSCYSLKSVPLFNTAAGTNFNSMFNSCYSLQSVPLFNTAAGTNFSTMFYNCFSLQVGALSGTSYDITYPAGQLSATQLNAIYTNLATITGKTITITDNYGAAGDNPSIATAKGWTCVG